MIVGQVVGNVVSTRKYEELQGYKLLVIQVGETRLVAADELGAGVGETVLVTKGQAVKAALRKPAPIDALVVGIVDGEFSP
ncbi:MAG: EutN/CcmL family microcompartment protein [Turicibacter sp.]|nr:EutN/CcmL family microcompartment protein [Turicibacter sp.]